LRTAFTSHKARNQRKNLEARLLQLKPERDGEEMSVAYSGPSCPMCGQRTWLSRDVGNFTLHKCSRCGYTRLVLFTCPACGYRDALEMLHYDADAKAFKCRRCKAVVSTLEDYEKQVIPLITK